MPQTAIRLLELARDPDCGPAEFAVPIEADPGLTVQVLRFVNSSYFGFRNEISNVEDLLCRQRGAGGSPRPVACSFPLTQPSWFAGTEFSA